MLRHDKLVAICLFACLCGCAGILADYDPVTYKSLTDIKPEILGLYDAFGRTAVDKDGIKAMRLRLEQMYEYENGKGALNAETAVQMQKILDMFNRHAEDRLKNGKWTKTHFENCRDSIANALDIAIRTEQLKIKMNNEK
ncbi:MAG: hypothetical protein HZA48_11300 [Planctomycetes bacterium]|nr:hypothetical protein [Planctomycetota bacterium]